MATSPREDKLTAWILVGLGSMALIGGFIEGRQLKPSYPAESTMTIAFVIGIAVVLIGFTFPVLRSKRREDFSQDTTSDDTAV